MSDSDHTLRRLVHYERAQKEHFQATVEKYKAQLAELAAHYSVVTAAFLELEAIIEHAGISLNNEILTKPTWTLIMELRLRRDG